MRCLHLAVVGILSFPSLSASTTLTSRAICTSQSRPNPIYNEYPNNATGTINGTLAILPIPLALARSLIPSQYAILTSAISAVLPTFPPDTYPCMLQAVHDHDVGMAAVSFKVPDFSRAGIEFPFLDLLGDNSTPFRWAPELLMTATNLVAISGAVAYGTVVHPATFDPECDAYAAAAPPAAPGTTTYSATSVLPSVARLSAVFSTLGSGETNPYPLAFWKNVTNQPSFANAVTCDEMVRYFNTSVSTGANVPVPVKGRVEAKLNTFGEKVWESLYGIRTDSAFVENNYLSCPSLKGYGGRT